MAIFPGSAIPSAVSVYEIDNSLRFNPGDSPVLNRTGTSADGKTFTFSVWIKRGNISLADTNSTYYCSNIDAAEQNFRFGFGSGDNLFARWTASGASAYSIVSTAVFRDPSAWYHIVWAIDTTQAVAGNRIKAYVNGSEITAWDSITYPALNQEVVPAASSPVLTVGMYRWLGTNYSPFDGEMAEFFYIDAAQLTPSSFGETSSTTNQWIPIDAKDDLTFGTNGFYLKFQDSAALGDDSSGNTNDFTSSGLVATDQMIDTPTNNFATLNPLVGYAGYAIATPTFSEGNLKCKTNTSGGGGTFASNFAVSSGKWYTEYYVEAESHSNLNQVGLTTDLAGLCDASSKYYGGTSTSWGLTWNGYIANNDSTSSYDTSITYAVGDVVSTALDLTNSKLYFAVNGTWLNSSDPTSGATGTGAVSITSGLDDWVIGASIASDAGSKWVEGVMNYGADSSFAGEKTSGSAAASDSKGKGDFYYTPPTDFLALCTDNLSAPEIALPGDNFNTVIWSGNDADDREITGVGFQPDLIWNKRRSAIGQHQLQDSLRGVTKVLKSSSSTTEGTETNSTKSFDSDGFTVGTDGNINGSGTTYVAWNWKAGGAPTADNDNAAGAVPDLGSVMIDGVASTAALAGTIAAKKISANTTSGFSIVEYTGTGVASTVAHGLSTAPTMVIAKNFGGPTSAANEWAVYSEPVGNTKALFLDGDSTGATSINFWNNATPTSSVFSVYQSTTTNDSGEFYIAYCFSNIEGYSKVGSYVGNSSTDGTFVYCGFKPAYIMQKNISATSQWNIWDVKRDTYNVAEKRLLANSSSAELDGYTDVDILSNGFKWRRDSGDFNYTGNSNLYIAFAESPFKYSNAR